MKRLRTLLSVAALVTAGYVAGVAHLPERQARATYRISITDPAWTFDPLEIEKQVASFAKTNGITGQAAWAAFITGLSATQSTAVSRGLLSAVSCSAP